LAISFTKGCYLGQETIARADALGHMNRRLMGLQFPSDQVPPAGTCVEVGGKTVATVTSAAWSYQLQSPLAMAYVRRGDDVLGRRIPTRFGEAVIVAFPRR
jgi:folate-binding Fe-S cluster repair protein YgfZ